MTALEDVPEAREGSTPGDDLAPCYELKTLEELRALADPLRVAIVRLLKEKERTVKELCDLLDESSTRLYYHVGELERLGLIRLVRTEAKSGVVHKYYRAVARWLQVPLALLHDDPESAEARAGVEWYARLLENAAMDVRSVLTENIDEIDRETTFFTRSWVRTTPERARRFVEDLTRLAEELAADDDAEHTYRVAFTSAFLPAPRFTFGGEREAAGATRFEARNSPQEG